MSPRSEKLAATCGKLSDDDFPTGLSRPPDHPKVKHLKELIREYSTEYRVAAKKTEERWYGDRRMLSRTAIIDLVASEIMPTISDERRGYFKKYKAGRWMIDNESENNPQKLRTRISNQFNKCLKVEDSARGHDEAVENRIVPFQDFLRDGTSSPHDIQTTYDVGTTPNELPNVSCNYSARQDRVRPKGTLRASFLADPPSKKSTMKGSQGDSCKTMAIEYSSDDWEPADLSCVLNYNASFDLFCQDVLLEEQKFPSGRPNIMTNQCSEARQNTDTFPSNKTIFDTDEDRTRSSKNVESVLTAMRKNSEDANVQKSCCRLLGEMACASAGTSFVDLKGPQTIIETMGDHKENAAVQQLACYALGQWAGVHLCNQTAIVAAGCFVSILTAVRQHTKRTKVQSYAFFALANLMREHLVNQSTPGSVACIRATMSSMNLHQDDLEVQYYGCLALGSMVRNHRQNQSLIGATNGVEVVLKAMKLHKSNAELQSNCFKTLGCLVWKHSTNRSNAIVENGALHQIMSTMDLHAGHTNVQCNGCFALGCLAYNNPDNQSALVATKVREKAVALLERYVLHPRVVEASCHLLYSCCLLAVETSQDSKVTAIVFDDASLSSMEAYQIISTAVHKHGSSNHQIAHCGSILLRNMPSSLDNSKNDATDLTDEDIITMPAPTT